MNRLVAWLEAKNNAPPPVPGWLTQWLLIAAWFVSFYLGHHVQAATYIAASLVIGVIRQLERSKRDGRHG